VKRALGTAVLAVLLAAGALFCSGPFFWQVLTSLRPEDELTRLDLPSALSLESYRGAFSAQPLGRAMLNSVLVSGVTTALCLLVGSAAAFALAKLSLRGRGVLLGGALLASMFPSVATVSALYLVIRALGLRDHLSALVIPYTTFALPMTIWIMHGFFRGLPDEIFRAAQIDGCTPLQAFFRVMLPLAAPGLGTTAILVFISAYNELLYALTFISSPQKRTVPVAISMFAGEHREPWGEIAAASVVAMLPVLAAALLFQRWIVRGLTSGAVKG
jgi:multiple sugar transport system permease protein